jgi:hypothetical protein
MKTINRDKIQRMVGRGTGGGGGGGISVDLAGYASQAWVEQQYISKEFFLRLFSIHGHNAEDTSVNPEDIIIEPNDTDEDTTVLDSIEAKAGLWTNSFVSALGLSPSGGGYDNILLEPLLSINSAGLGRPTRPNVGIVWNGTRWVYGETGGGSTGMNPLTVKVGTNTTVIEYKGETAKTLTFDAVANSGITVSGDTLGTIKIGYTLPTASANTLGGVKVGNTLSISDGVLNLPTISNLVAGTYRSVTVDAYGRVTAGTNPTTLAGYGITDAKIANGVITLGTNTITPLTDAKIKSDYEWWGQKMSTNGKVNGNVFINMSTFDLSKTDNGVATTIWPGFRVMDNANRNSFQAINAVSANGTNAGRISVYNYNTSGTSVADKGMTISVAKNGDCSISLEGTTTIGGNLTLAATSGTYIKIGGLYLVYDQNNNAIKVSASPTGNTTANFYATGAVSALGISDSGGASTFDESQMWQALGTSITTKKIKQSYLDLTGYVQTSALSAYVKGVKVNGTSYTTKDANGIVDLGEIKADTSDFVTLSTAQTITGAKTFNSRLSISDGTDEKVLLRADNEGGNIRIYSPTSLKDEDGNQRFWEIDSFDGNLRFYTRNGGQVSMKMGTDGFLNTTGQGKLWGVNNDGANSGLDADLLDGQHGSYYAKATDVTTLRGYFTDGVANSAAKLNDTETRKFWNQTYWLNGKPAAADITGDLTGTGKITTSKVTNTWRSGNLGEAIINSSAAAGAYVMLAKMNTTNGVMTHGVHQHEYVLQYTSNTTISGTENKVDRTTVLMDESGNMSVSGLLNVSGSKIYVQHNNITKASLYADNEGGNLQLISGQNWLDKDGWEGHFWEMDSFDGNLRFYNFLNKVNGDYREVKFYTDGSVKANRLYLYKPNDNNDTNAVYLLYDSNGGVHLVGAGFYADTFVSALGKGDDGGASTFDESQMWKALGTNINTKVIPQSHLNLTGYAKTSDLNAYVKKVKLNGTEYTPTNGTVDLGTITVSGYLPLTGGTMTGQIKTSFKQSVAMGSYEADATTIPNLCEELRYSSGASGSANIEEAYTKDGVTISAKWYNFIWMPHRFGGANGAASGDNTNFGSLLLSAMTGSAAECYLIRYSSQSIQNVVRLWDSSNDGSGSGLDADLLDGQHGSYYATASGLTAANTNITTLQGYFTNGVAKSAGDSAKLSGKSIVTKNLYKPYDRVMYIDDVGGMEVGKFFDFHHDNTTGSDFSTRLQVGGNYGNSVTLPSSTGTLALTSDNVASASKLKDSHSLWGNSFNGTQDIFGNIEIRYNSKKKLLLYANGEGGNIRIYSPDSYTINNEGETNHFWEIDSYNGNLRIYNYNSSYAYKSVSLSRDLDFSGVRNMQISGSLTCGSGENTYVQIGGAKLIWDGSALKCDKDFYSTGAVSALGANASGGSGSGIDANWLKTNDVQIQRLGIGVAPSSSYQLNVLGSSYFNGPVSVNGDVTVTGKISSSNSSISCKHDITAGGRGLIQERLTVGDTSVNTSYQLYVNGSSLFSGNVGIGGYDNACKLYVSGKVKFSKMSISNTTNPDSTTYTSLGVSDSLSVSVTGSANINKAWVVSSDMRLKDVCQHFDIDITSVAKAPLFTYRLKNSGSQLMVGTSAQYWMDKIPETVTLGYDGYYGLDYNGVLTASVISVARKVVDHELRVKQLEERIAELENEINELKAA